MKISILFTGIVFLASLSSCRDHSHLTQNTDTATLSSNDLPVLPDTSLFFKAYNTEQGIISSELLNVYADRLGYVWLASGKGLMKFDGLKFTPFFDEIDKNIRLKGPASFFEDNRGTLWVLSGSGFLHRFDRESNSFKAVKSRLENGWSDESPMFIFQNDENHLWMGGYGGIQLLDLQTDSVSLYPVEKIRTPDWPHKEKVRVEAFQKDSNGSIWVGTRKFGLAKFDPETGLYDFLRDRPAFLNRFLDDWVTGIAKGEDGTFWVSDYEKGLVHFDPRTETVIDLIEVSKLISSSKKVNIRAILKEGPFLWLATNDHGLLLYHIEQGRVINTFNSANSDLPFDQIKSICKDQLGNYWISGNQLVTASSMFYKFKMFATANLPVYDLAELSEGVLASTSAGIFELKGDTEASLISKDKDYYFGLLKSKNGHLWAGKTLELIDFQEYGRVLKTYPYTQVLDSVGNQMRRALKMQEDSEGKVWIIDNWNRLKFINPATGEAKNIFALAQDPVSKKFIQVLCVLDDSRRNQILVGTDLGLVRVNKENYKLNWVKTDLRFSESVTYLYRDSEDKIWGIIAGKIYEINLENETLEPLQFKDRHANEDFTWIVEEPAGTYWLQSSSGIIQFDGERTSLYANSNFSEGSQKKPAPVMAAGGKVYYGGEAGITVIDPTRVSRSLVPPLVSLEYLKIPFRNSQGQLKDSTIFIAGKNGIKLKYDQNKIALKFNALHFKEPSINSLRYKLEGYDEDFSDPGTFQEAYYTNLNPGTYTLQYSGANSDGVWSEIKSFNIIITPPWYQTWWAWVLYLSLFSLAIYGWIRYRVFMKLEKYKATEEMRTAISADLHDDVGSLLAGLSMKSELMSMGIKPVEVESLNQISQMARDAMERMRDTVWAIDSRKDKVENLLDRMRAFTEQNLPEKGFSYDFKTINIDRSDFINPLIRQNIYLIHKEAVTNILKHSNGNYVEIILEQKTEQFRYRIKDNGTLKNGLSTDGLGMSNIQARARKMQGSLHTLYDEGFVVEVTV